MSSLQSISGCNLDSDLVQKFLKDYTILAKMAKTLFFVGSQVMWESLVMKKQMQLQSQHYLSVTSMKLPATDMYPRITKLIFNEWQEVWNCCDGNKLHAIRPTVGGYKLKTSIMS